jgi:hypothetical protein
MAFLKALYYRNSGFGPSLSRAAIQDNMMRSSSFVRNFGPAGRLIAATMIEAEEINIERQKTDTQSKSAQDRFWPANRSGTVVSSCGFSQ